jgi:cation diffusion facilitator family transporter
MHIKNLERWRHPHHFNRDDQDGERNTRRVILLTVAMMVLEIVAGVAFGSMALLADGWHMGTHAFALGITAFTYMYARRNSTNPRYSFGTGKVGVLGGFTSAVVLAIVAMLMAVESFQRLISPTAIQFSEAIGVAVIGLVINLVSAFLLQGHHHGHDHDHDHDDHHGEDGGGHQDHNLRAAYLHVLADAMTSVLAIVALIAGRSLGWVWMDPIMGIVGSLVIGQWSYGLLRDTSRILLDSGVDQERRDAIQAAIESDADNRVTDLHIWPVSSRDLAVIVTVVTHYPRPVAHYKNLLSDFRKLAHVTIEVIHCSSEPCVKVPKVRVAA